MHRLRVDTLFASTATSRVSDSSFETVFMLLCFVLFYSNKFQSQFTDKSYQKSKILNSEFVFVSFAPSAFSKSVLSGRSLDSALEMLCNSF